MDVKTMTSAEIVNELEERLAADLEGMSPERAALARTLVSIAKGGAR